MRPILPALIVFIAWLAAAPAAAQEWGCYDPRPGHPSDQEKADFVTAAGAAAVAAEKKYGVPAPAIAAMAIVESGYGWTRTALEAKNYFGWKYYSDRSAGGRAAYVLSCQPPEDVNNKYVVFDSLEESVDFVAMKLSTLDYYHEASRAYRRTVAAGADPTEATRLWLERIANPYNWRPEAYVRSVTRVMNDPVRPSDALSAERNLFRLASLVRLNEPTAARPTVAPAVAKVEPAAIGATDAFLDHALAKVKPWNGSCDAPETDRPGWEGFPVTLCRYSDVGATVSTYMLNPDKTKLARWIATACRDAGARKGAACVDYLVKEIKTASSMGVFPVSGYIPEPAGDGNYCFLFRDGVTITTARRPRQLPPASGGCDPDDHSDEAALKARKFARVASTTRYHYRVAGGLEDVGEDGDVRWLDVVRKLYQEAWTSDRNQLISAKAIAAKKAGDIE